MGATSKTKRKAAGAPKAAAPSAARTRSSAAAARAPTRAAAEPAPAQSWSAGEAWSNEAAGDLATIAYERIEQLFISTRLAPGASLRMQDLQTRVGIGRTPVHQAVRRLAAGTLLEIRPRNGLRVAPVDLHREKHLALLRRDLDRFVIEAAIGGMTANQRAALQHMRKRLETAGATMDLDAFNVIDQAFDKLLIDASGEPFLERVLGPLHALGRRLGYINIAHVTGRAGLDGTIERHLAIMDAVLRGASRRACAASDALVAFSVSMIEELEKGVDPALLDMRFAPPQRVAAE